MWRARLITTRFAATASSSSLIRRATARPAAVSAAAAHVSGAQSVSHRSFHQTRTNQQASSGLSLPLAKSVPAHPAPQRNEESKFEKLTASVKGQWKVGSTVHGFKVHKIEPISEFGVVAAALQHEHTGANYLHIFTDDTNNFFSVGFPTVPQDSTGSPHILEHTALCGSQKFPIRDPFMKMTNRSLANFMNAMTGSDFTVYPFSTVNASDFDNLRSVYLDAVFFPLLREEDFRQEGWRLEHEKVDDNSTPIVVKGVVYNEMKGDLSTGEVILRTKLGQALYPGSPYEHCYGGDPAVIPSLSHRDLVAFHRRHYHPSNARFFTYGNMPLERHLNHVDQVISKVEGSDAAPITIAPVKRYSSPQTLEIAGPEDFGMDPERPIKMNISFLLNEVKNISEHLNWNILNRVLFSGPTSPFYKALIEGDLGTEFTSTTGYDGSTREATFSVGLQNVRVEDVDKVQETILACIQNVAENGVDHEQVEAALESMEISKKYISAHFGRSIAMGIYSLWMHGADPIELLKSDTLLTKFKSEYADGELFKKMAREQLLANPHRVTLIMKPSPDFAQDRSAKEQEVIDAKVSSLTADDREKVFAQGLHLKKLQEAEQDFSCLPILNAEDVAKEIQRVHKDFGCLGGIPALWRETTTNDIAYFKAVCTIQGLPEDLVPYLPLFCHALTSLGTKDRSHEKLSTDIQLYTGGLSFTPILAGNHSDINLHELSIGIASFAFNKNVDRMFDLITSTLLQTNFKNFEQLQILLFRLIADFNNGLADAGSAYAASSAASSLSRKRQLDNILGGLEQGIQLRKMGEESIEVIAEKLAAIQRHVANRKHLRVAFVCEPKMRSNLESMVPRFLDQIPIIPTSSMSNQETAFSPMPARKVLETELGINFTAQVFRSVPYTNPDSVVLSLLSEMLTSKYLHKEIREKGGAYGGGATHSGDGMFTFYSYRDPNVLQTLDVYSKSIDYALSNPFTQENLWEAKLSAFADMDKPRDLCDQGLHDFFQGVNDAMIQRRREKLFKATLDDVARVTASYLKNPVASGGSGSVCALADKQAASELRGDFEVLDFSAL